MKIKRLLTMATLAVLGVLGLTNGVKVSQAYLSQQQTLSQVPTLVSEVGDGKKAKDIAELKAQQQKLQTTIVTLETVPHFPGFNYDKAQTELGQLRTLFNTLTQRIQTEEQAAADLETARRLDAEAHSMVQNPPHAPEVWQQAREKWQQAIQLLQGIPTGTFIATQVKEGLATSQTNYSVVSKNLAVEDKAFRQIDVALAAADTAASLNQNKPYDLADLTKAKLYWQRAVNTLMRVTGDSSVATDAKELLSMFQRNLASVNDAIEQLKQCQKDDSFSSLCSYDVAIELEMPTDEVALDSGSVDTASVYEDSDSSSTTVVVPPVVPYGRYRRHSGLSSSTSVSSFSGGSGRTYVRSYTRKDGTRVQGHTRSSGGSRSSGFGSSRSGGASS
jgi:hypothetical protein